MIIFYNPQCSKCQEALGLLEANSCAVTIRNYLEEPPGPEELQELLKKLGCRALDLVRKSEPLFIEKFSDGEFTEEQWIRILSEHPVLLQRPIVIDGDKAIVGRPPVLVLDLLAR